MVVVLTGRPHFKCSREVAHVEELHVLVEVPLGGVRLLAVGGGAVADTMVVLEHLVVLTEEVCPQVMELVLALQHCLKEDLSLCRRTWP